jgi:hypothetical protein
MSSSAPKAPTPVDPQKIIAAQAAANRVNRITPFGSQTYGPDGLTTSLNPGMQGIVDNQTALASQPYTRLEHPQGMDDLAASLMSKVSAHNQPQGQKPAGQQMPQIGAINGQQTNPAMQAALQRIWTPR